MRKEMKKIAGKIKNAEKIVIAAHINEDADAVGSSFALTEALRDAGKSVMLYMSEEPEDRLKFLKCDYEIYTGEELPEQELFIALDSADEERLGARKALLLRSPSVSVDHHYTNTRYADVNYVDGEASSTGELVYFLIKELELPITRRIAEFLYISISGDTGSFKYSCTTPTTMRVAAELLECGIEHAELARRLYESEKPEAVRLKGYVMSSVKSFFGGKLNMTVLDKEIFAKFGVDEKNAGDLVNIPRTIEGTEIAVSVRETEEKIKLSFRSNGKYNVSEIAAHFGGGGHVMAAGAAVYGKTLAETEEEIVSIVGECFND